MSLYDKEEGCFCRDKDCVYRKYRKEDLKKTIQKIQEEIKELSPNTIFNVDKIIEIMENNFGPQLTN